MPSRKQRRRRQKERRHEYEFVYVDEEGREVEPPPAEERSNRRPVRDAKSARNGKATRRGWGGRVRESQPPSWKRSLRRALLFFPLFFIVFSLINRKTAIEARLLGSLAYSALFIPLTYVMDRTAYRAYLRRSGREPGAKRR
jgi:hypothetical protein